MSLDPFASLFDGKTAADLFGTPDYLVRHGSVDRLPQAIRADPFTSIEAFFGHYRGRFDISGGSPAVGYQGEVSGIPPQGALAAGLTVMCKDMDASTPQVKPWLRSLEQSAGHPLGSALLLAFVNAPGSGLALHHDVHDQILINLVGDKHIRLAKNTTVQHPALQVGPGTSAPFELGQHYHAGLPPDAEGLMAASTDVVMRPGTALFLPAGTWHTTVDQPGQTLTLTVVHRAPTTAKLLCHYLQAYLEQSPRWRRPAHGGWGAGAGEQAALLEERMDELRAHLSVLSGDPAFAAWSLKDWVTGSPLYPDHPWQRFIRRQDARVAFEPSEVEGQIHAIVRSGSLIVPVSQQKLTLFSRARDVIEWVVASERSFSIDELVAAFSDAGEPAIRELMGQLAAARLVRPIPVPEFLEPDEILD